MVGEMPGEPAIPTALAPPPPTKRPIDPRPVRRRVRIRQHVPIASASSMASIPNLSAHGAEMPAIGLGTSSLGRCAEIVATALKLGYRHIDTAWKYGTERSVGDGI